MPASRRSSTASVGEAGGELASRAACGALATDLDRLPPRGDLEGRHRWLAPRYKAARAAIALSRRLHKGSTSQGTTAIAALLAGDKLLTACVGDSRAYRARDGALELHTTSCRPSLPPAPARARRRSARRWSATRSAARGMLGICGQRTTT